MQYNVQFLVLMKISMGPKFMKTGLVKKMMKIGTLPTVQYFCG